MALSAFTAQQGVSAGSSGHIGDHNEIRSQIQEILDELLLYRQGRRNVIRNGDMGVGQRTSPWTTSGVYTTDGWIMSFSGGTMTVSRAVTTVGSGLGADGAKVYSRSVVAAQAAVGDFAIFHHRVEDVRTLAGKTVTLSFIAAAASGTPKIGVEVEQVFGTGGSPSATVQTAVQAVPISTTATRYSVSFAIPSISGKTLGSGGNDYLQVNLWLSAGSTYASRASSIGIQNATIDITDVQLEQGSGSPFERLPQQEQLAWNQRYYLRRSGADGAGSQSWGVGVVGSSTTALITVPFPVPMRTAPAAWGTGVGASSTTFQSTLNVYDATAIPQATSMNVLAANLDRYGALLGVICSGGGLTTGRGCYLIPGDSTAALTFTAEL